MKVTFPTRARKPAPQGERALTLMEMMVAITLLMVIVMGLTTMFLQTQKAFKGGLRQVDVFESERLVMDMITRDLEQMADANHGTNCYNFYYANSGPILVQCYTNPVSLKYEPFRTNYSQDILILARTNDQWVGIGYCVSNVLSGSGNGGVGTLYRYSTNLAAVGWTNNILLSSNFFFTNYVRHSVGNFQDFHRVADGIIHLSIRTYDTSGRLVTNNMGNWYPYPNIATTPPVWVPLPGFVEVELGMLEPETFEQARAMGNFTAATNFLTPRVSRVHVFRQQIPIRAASR